jgi:hypothetical protein
LSRIIAITSATSCGPSIRRAASPLREDRVKADPLLGVQTLPHVLGKEEVGHVVAV